MPRMQLGNTRVTLDQWRNAGIELTLIGRHEILVPGHPMGPIALHFDLYRMPVGYHTEFDPSEFQRLGRSQLLYLAAQRMEVFKRVQEIIEKELPP